jgi:hypothetical protein
MIFIGIDPGGSGAVAAIDGAGRVVGVIKNASTERDLWDAIAGWCQTSPRIVAVIEQVHSFPEQGVAATFTFGASYGFFRGFLTVIGALFGARSSEVAPQKWQRVVGVPKRAKDESKTSHKNKTKARAQQLFPGLKITHANADALLLAEYARITWTSALPASSLPAQGSPEQAGASRSAFPAAEPHSPPAIAQSDAASIPVSAGP